jgi:hypothetical protein
MTKKDIIEKVALKAGISRAATEKNDQCLFRPDPAGIGKRKQGSSAGIRRVQREEERGYTMQAPANGGAD